jgi:1,2-dihydroxy-3-keto-5-methylthiopentene dioxygenase
MSRLRIFEEVNPGAPRVETRDHAEIARELAARGIRFEQWQAGAKLEPGASPDQVISAYAGDIERLKREKNYQAVDVISLNQDHPEKGALRQKFLNEHTHSEDEVRFFVAGAGLFTLHLGEEVCEVLCEQGDLIAVPDNTRHWFDMGPNPYFIAIRLFSNPAGWVANYTGNEIAQAFPRLDN